MNRLVSINLEDVAPGRLPPVRPEGPTRMLFIHGNILGFKNVARQLKHYTADRDDIDAVHIDLIAPLWMKLIGKSIPGAGGWDFHSYRYLKMWGQVMRRWFTGPLSLEHFDVVHLMTQGNAWAMMSVPPAAPVRFAINIDATAVRDVSEFGYAPPTRGPFIRAERAMFARADLMSCRNAWAGRSLREDFGVPEEKIHVAANSMKVPSVPRPPRTEGGPVRLVFVGNNWKRKGGDLVLRVHQASFADRVELHVLGAKTPVNASARRVEWHGFVPREKLLTEVLPSMDIFVIASRFDMLPWAALEAAGAGLPLVAPRVGGLPEIVVDGETGFLFEPGDETGLAHAIRRLVDDSSLRERCGRAARTRLETHFDPDRTYPALLDRLCALAPAEVTS